MTEGSNRRLPKIEPVERRTFLRYSMVGAVGAGLGAFGVASLGFLWPNLAGGFGADITLPLSAEDLYNQINSEKAPFVFPAGRMYVVTWNPSLPGAEEQYGEEHIMLDGERGLMALYHKCVHLGCRVPWCQTSQWFECPCHGSKYNRYGEWMSGPAPRGLDRFPSQVNDDGQVIVSTGTIITGPARTARILQQEPEGPHCVNI
ncbi:MAG: ubiquinol-cytochrome c reductase iron-sulfur subunit [Nitriliruptorales bacterium]|nr:ubiquinol-cytochrome c reductase iron-sulfur subunit [Nitriliruptorales bacterium]